MDPKICPQCGTPQQWEIWRRCLCGHDFGPPSGAVLAAQKPKKTPAPRPWAPPSHARLWTAWLLVSIGCGLLLSTVWISTPWSSFSGTFVVFAFCCLPGPEVRRPIKGWLHWLILLGFLAVIVALLVIGERLDRHPAPAITLWVVLMIALYLRWRWQRRSLAPATDAKVASPSAAANARPESREEHP